MPTIQQLERLLAIDPEDDFVLYGLAMEHARIGEHERALSFFDRAIRANASNAYHFFHKAVSLEAMSREHEAITTLRAGLESARAGGDPKAMSELSGYLERLESEAG